MHKFKMLLSLFIFNEYILTTQEIKINPPAVGLTLPFNNPKPNPIMYNVITPMAEMKVARIDTDQSKIVKDTINLMNNIIDDYENIVQFGRNDFQQKQNIYDSDSHASKNKKRGRYNWKHKKKVMGIIESNIENIFDLLRRMININQIDSYNRNIYQLKLDSNYQNKDQIIDEKLKTIKDIKKMMDKIEINELERWDQLRQRNKDNKYEIQPINMRELANVDRV